MMLSANMSKIAAMKCHAVQLHPHRFCQVGGGFAKGFEGDLHGCRFYPANLGACPFLSKHVVSPPG